MHCLDVMHMENNVCENVIWTICGNKDNKEVKRDLEVQNLRSHLWFTHNPQNSSQWVMPHANYVLNVGELFNFPKLVCILKGTI
jgi:5-methylcytosine-specific restriction endonuclease McrA